MENITIGSQIIILLYFRGGLSKNVDARIVKKIMIGSHAIDNVIFSRWLEQKGRCVDAIENLGSATTHIVILLRYVQYKCCFKDGGKNCNR